MNAPQVFSFMFFLMVCLLAMSTVSASWAAVVAALLDEVPVLRKYETQVSAFLCRGGGTTQHVPPPNCMIKGIEFFT